MKGDGCGRTGRGRDVELGKETGKIECPTIQGLAQSASSFSPAYIIQIRLRLYEVPHFPVHLEY